MTSVFFETLAAFTSSAVTCRCRSWDRYSPSWISWVFRAISAVGSRGHYPCKAPSQCPWLER